MGRGRWVGAAALLLVGVAAGCGQSDGGGAGGSEQIEIKTVAANTEAAGTAKFEGSFQPARNSGAPGGHFEGEIDFANGRSAVRSVYDAVGKEGAHETETRLVDGWTYFKTPPLEPGEQSAGTPTPWYRLRLPSLGGSMLPVGMSVDVTGYLDVLQSMGARTEVVGTESVRGTPTTRYRVTRSEPSDVPAQLRVGGSFSPARSDAGSIDLWADDAGRIRRVVTSFGSESSEGGGGGGSSSVELFDFGAPVTIEAPPLDQVTTQPSMPEPRQYRLAATGTSDGEAWKVFVAEEEHAQDHARCVEVEADVAQWFRALVGADGGRVSLGCSSSSSSTSVPGAQAPPPLISVDVRPQAVPLADGRALLISEVPEGTTAVTIRRRGGGEQTVTPTSGWFGTALAHDEVADVISFTGPSGSSTCRLRDGDYDCDTAGVGASGSSVSSSSVSSSSASGSVSGSSSSSSSSASTTVPPATTAR